MTATVNRPCQPISAITDMSRESRCPAAGRVLRGALCHEVRLVQAGLAILQRHPVIHSTNLLHRELAVDAPEFLSAITRIDPPKQLHPPDPTASRTGHPRNPQHT